MIGLFEFTGVLLTPQDARNVVRQYSWEDLRPYVPTPEQQARYNQGLSQYRMFPEAPLDERFADFKARLTVALERRKLGH